MKLTDFLTLRVRPAIGDTEATQRWSDARLVAYCNDGVRQISQMHPEAKYVSTVTTDAPTDMTAGALNVDIPLTDYFLEPLWHFVVYHAMSEDSEDAANLELSKHHLDEYRKLV